MSGDEGSAVPVDSSGDGPGGEPDGSTPWPHTDTVASDFQGGGCGLVVSGRGGLPLAALGAWGVLTAVWLRRRSNPGLRVAPRTPTIRGDPPEV